MECTLFAIQITQNPWLLILALFGIAFVISMAVAGIISLMYRFSKNKK